MSALNLGSLAKFRLQPGERHVQEFEKKTVFEQNNKERDNSTLWRLKQIMFYLYHAMGIFNDRRV